MRAVFFLLLASGLAASAAAQVAPVPSFDDPRLQTVAYDPARPVRLVAFPGANLTVMLLPGDPIERVIVSDRAAFEVQVTGSSDSLNIAALRPDAAATMIVETRARRYEFDVATGRGLAAAYVVRFLGGTAAPPFAPMPPAAPAAEPLPLIGEYRLSGDKALRPASIADDGLRTYIEWGEHQALPAVFGIGPTGEEEVVPGYMRGGRFVIDRVYGELVFRIDKERARARRRVDEDRR